MEPWQWWIGVILLIVLFGSSVIVKIIEKVKRNDRGSLPKGYAYGQFKGEI